MFSHLLLCYEDTLESFAVVNTNDMTLTIALCFF